MRIFTAVTLPDDVRHDLEEQLDVLRTVRTDLRWVPAPNLHLTVRFLGECGPREVDRQIEHWHERCAGVRPLDLRLAAAGCFPHTWMAKVLWAGVQCDEQRWARLAGPDQVPHVTVARTRIARDLIGAVHELADYRSRSWQANEITMYQSFLDRGRGPRYVALETFALGSDRDVAQ